MTSAGPRGPINHGAPTGISAPRALVLAELRKDLRQHQVRELASALDLHPNTVREHLDALVEDRIVVRESSTPVGRGRPALVYRALSGTDEAARDYELLTEVLAAEISRMPGAGVISERAGRDWGRRMLARGQSRPGLDGALETMERLGFDPSTPAENQVVLRSCPILTAARRDPEVVCTVHLGLARELVEAGGGAGDELGLIPMGHPSGCVLLLGGAEIAAARTS